MGFFSNLFGRGEKSPVKPPSFANKDEFFLPNKKEFLVWDSVKSLENLRDASEGIITYNTSNKTVRCHGIVSGDKLPKPKNSQDEKAVAIRINLQGWSFEGFIFDAIPGGLIVLSRYNDFNKCTWVNIGEDAISTPRSTSASKPDQARLLIRNCKFYNDNNGDKSVQLNNASQCSIRDSFFTGGQTAIRVQANDDRKPIYMDITGCEFNNIPTAINAAGVTVLEIKDNKYIKVSKNLVKSSGSKIRVI